MENLKKIHEKENQIFEEFEKVYRKQDLVYDGLHCLGDFNYLYADGGRGYWDREYGNEEEQWKEYCKQNKGLVIITKDLNDTVAWDIRGEHGRKNEYNEPTPTKIIFYYNLRNWVHCLLNIDENGNTPDYPEIEDAQASFENKPWVRMNLKKTPGGNRLSYYELKKCISETKELLLEQFKLYEDASIYLDCSRRHGIELLKEIYTDLKPFGDGYDEWIYYSLEAKKLVVNSYHPSYPVAGGREAYYGRMQNAIKSFLRNTRTFLRQFNKNKCNCIVRDEISIV